MAASRASDSSGFKSSHVSKAIQIWCLPDVVLFKIVSFAAAPTHRATLLCHTIAPLCSAAFKAILEEEHSAHIWDMVLKEDYGAKNADDSHSKVQRRACKRLKRSPVHRVRDAHLLLKDNTEIAYFYLSELVNASTKQLTKARLCGIFNEYGPHLRVNHLVSNGGVFLVEVCRTKQIKEAVVLKCVQELVEHWGAHVDVRTNESLCSKLTALCVASVRAMPSVVQYLLEKGSSRDIQSSGRFRLSCNPKKSVRCVDATPLEFAQAMLKAEKENGANDLTGLLKCIKLLTC
jgi:hypothetical protein